MHLWLIGMMGSGKSVVGKILAAKWGRETVDLDREIERSSGSSIASIFRGPGEAAFRKLESRAVARVAASKRPLVIATGGGAILSDANVAAMRESGRIVWLDAPVRVLARRVADSSRPLLAGKGAARELEAIRASRRLRYEEAADVRVESGEGRPVAVAARVERALEAQPIRYHVRGAETAIHVQAGLFDRAGDLVRTVVRSDRAVVITDDVVGPKYAKRLVRSLRRAGYLRVPVISIRAGERHKNAATVRALWSELVRLGIDRSTLVVALGGGVVGDVAGFAAATILRGVPVVQVPTTLIAQVDSAIGGKTGFDLPEGKNLVGAFKHPELVIADPLLLSTLPPPELRAGMAEVVKYGVILDANLFASLETASWAHPAVLERVVRRCADLKAGVVERDPDERGERAILNFGHTVGHALEAASGYRLRHGEAVAVGMLAEAELACETGMCASRDVERLACLLSALQLPVAVHLRGAGKFIGRDKKRSGRVARMPMLRRIGRVSLERVQLVELMRRFAN